MTINATTIVTTPAPYLQPQPESEVKSCAPMSQTPVQSIADVPNQPTAPTDSAATAGASEGGAGSNPASATPKFHNPDNLASPGEGWRFLAVGERPQAGVDQYQNTHSKTWYQCAHNEHMEPWEPIKATDPYTYRTRRPLPTSPAPSAPVAGTPTPRTWIECPSPNGDRKHRWIGNICVNCGVGHAAYVDDLERAFSAATALAEERAREVEALKRERDKDVERAQRAGNNLYLAIFHKLVPHFPPDTRDLDWDVLPSAIKAIVKERDTLRAELAAMREERDAAQALLNAPELHSFRDGVVLEAAHQRKRWPSEQDAGKRPADWFWLVGYLAGKALHAQVAGNIEKTLHHTISTAAALANWHAAVLGATNMRPGLSQQAVAHVCTCDPNVCDNQCPVHGEPSLRPRDGETEGSGE